jgi:hypothetical protein
MKMAERLAAGARSPSATRSLREQAREGRAERRLRHGDGVRLVTFHSEDHQEALAAIREKRLPNFRTLSHNLFAALETTSIRRFTDEPVTDEEILICSAPRCRPSGGNIQPWQFVAVT